MLWVVSEKIWPCRWQNLCSLRQDAQCLGHLCCAGGFRCYCCCCCFSAAAAAAAAAAAVLLLLLLLLLPLLWVEGSSSCCAYRKQMLDSAMRNAALSSSEKYIASCYGSGDISPGGTDRLQHSRPFSLTCVEVWNVHVQPRQVLTPRHESLSPEPEDGITVGDSQRVRLPFTQRLCVWTWRYKYHVYNRDSLGSNMPLFFSSLSSSSSSSSSTFITIILRRANSILSTAGAVSFYNLRSAPVTSIGCCWPDCA